MPIIKVYKVADIIEEEIVFSPSARKSKKVLGGKLSDAENAQWTLFQLYPPANPIEKIRPWLWHLPNLRDYLSRSLYTGVNPIFIPEDKRTMLVYFRDRLFMSERVAEGASERAEVVLRVKKIVYDEEAELSGLRAAVANMEAAVEFQRSGPKRDPIPEDVKLLVWGRDGGRCVRCGSERTLHFDHIIPVAKGGGSTAANIQILCQTCNLKKSDRIAMP
jgi:hypothetical protein